MRVNDEARKSVVFFGVPTPEGIEYGGTGFMLADFEEGILIPYIVTARHVAEHLKQFSDTGFYLRANRKDGGNPVVEIERAEWAYHSDPTVDLAVAHLSLDGSLFDIIYYPLKDKPFFGDQDRVATVGTPDAVLCGDPVSIIGLFRLHFGKERNVPIVHTGHVAALPDANERIPIKDPLGKTFEAEAYLVEAQTLDGLSGSPVFTKEHLRLIGFEHHGEPAGAYGALVLLGLYVGSWEGHPGEILASDKGLRSHKIRVPVGMGIVVPVQKILEIVRGDAALNSYRKKRVEAVKATKATTR